MGYTKKFRKAYNRGVSDANTGTHWQHSPFEKGTKSYEAYISGWKDRTERLAPKKNQREATTPFWDDSRIDHSWDE